MRIVFVDRCTYLQNLVGWGFISTFMFLYGLSLSDVIYFEKASRSKKF